MEWAVEKRQMLDPIRIEQCDVMFDENFVIVEWSFVERNRIVVVINFDWIFVMEIQDLFDDAGIVDATKQEKKCYQNGQQFMFFVVLWSGKSARVVRRIQ